MIIDKSMQRTPEWRAARAGIPTASAFDMIITTKGEPSKQRQKYLYSLVAERIAGVAEDKYQSAAMERGIIVEDEARKMYELMTDTTVDQVGVCYTDDKKRYGCSPDGLVGKDGILEIKCPLSHTQVGYLLDGKLPTEYYQQTQGQLFVTGRKWCDFLSYYPGLKPLIIRVVPEPTFIKALQVEIKIFCKELDELTEKIRRI